MDTFLRIQIKWQSNKTKKKTNDITHDQNDFGIKIHE